VLFFRDQDLTPGMLLAAARQFGTPIEYPFVKGLEGYPEVIEVAKLERERVNFGGVWHSDTTYLESPPMGTFLLAKEIPPTGGDTIFSNMYLASETLSDGMRAMLDGLTAINSSAKADASRTREDRIRSAPKDGGGRVLEAEHPVLRTHPETGRKALYVNVAHTIRLGGMTEAESAPLLRYLFQHQTRPELTCRFRWRRGSLAFWDNRAAQHNAINDYPGCRRIMHRVTLAGDRPR
jgi:taurine dioxygenase